MAITFPQDCTTPSGRTEYCYRAQELLRLDHNAKVADYKDGKISKAEWQTYKTSTFDPKQETVIKELLKNRDMLKTSTKWNIDIGGI